MADSDTVGGTPIFASPECFEKKEKKSDIYSFGRVILFLLLTKTQFLRWLFVPIKDKKRILSLQTIRKTRILSFQNFIIPNVFYHSKGKSNVEPSKIFESKSLYWISQMISMNHRINLKLAREFFDELQQKSMIKLDDTLVTEFEGIIDDEISENSAYKDYVKELSDVRYGKGMMYVRHIQLRLRKMFGTERCSARAAVCSAQSCSAPIYFRHTMRVRHKMIYVRHISSAPKIRSARNMSSTQIVLRFYGMFGTKCHVRYLIPNPDP